MKKELLALVDVCDVIIDLRGSTIAETGIVIPPEKMTEWDMFNIINEDEAAVIKKLYDKQEFWRSLKMVDNADVGLEALMQQGFKVHFITSPWFSCENWESIRRAWLSEKFKWFHPLDMTVTAEKFRFRGDVFIDDRPKHVVSWQEAHPDKVAWLFDKDFNQYFNWHKRAAWSSTGIKEIFKGKKK